MQPPERPITTGGEAQGIKFSPPPPSTNTSRPWINSNFIPVAPVSPLSTNSFYIHRSIPTKSRNVEDIFYPTPLELSYQEPAPSAIYHPKHLYPLQQLGYPESSQRTLLEERTYTNRYNCSPADSVPVSMHSEQMASDATPNVHTKVYSGFAPLDGRPGAHLVLDREHPAFFSPLEPSYAASLTSPTVTASDSSPIGSPSLTQEPNISRPMADIFGRSGLSRVESESTPASTVVPLNTKDTLSPAVFTFQHCSDSLQRIDDPESRSLLTSFTESKDDQEEHAAYISHPGIPTRSSSPNSDNLSHRSRSSLEGAIIEQKPLDFGFSDKSTSSPHAVRSDSPVTHRHVGSTHSTTRRSPKRSTKKPKMHQCEKCQKLFPRPSGLATHMNSHSGARPYPCPMAGCNKTFAVRSNAKRHLRTHGLQATEPAAIASTFCVDFEAPVISHINESFKSPTRLRWIPQSLSTRTNVDWLQTSSPSESESDGGDDYPAAPLPLLAVLPSGAPFAGDLGYEERNSYAEMGTHPYHPIQWKALPGPAAVLRTHAAV